MDLLRDEKSKTLELESSLTQFKHTLTLSNSQIDSLKTMVKNLQAQNERLKKSNIELNQEANDLERKITLMDKMHREIQKDSNIDDNFKMKHELTRKENEIKHLSELLEIKNCDIKSLKDKLDEQKTFSKI